MVSFILREGRGGGKERGGKEEGREEEEEEGKGGKVRYIIKERKLWKEKKGKD